jgi:hypothetical protein
MSVCAVAQSSSQPGTQSSSSQSDLPSAPTPVAPAKNKTKPATTSAANPDPSAAPATDSSQHASPQGDTPKQSPNAPEAQAKKPAADDNAFPEEVSAAAAKAAAAAAASNAPSTTNQTPAEKQANGSSSLDNTDNLGLDDPARKQLKLGSPDGTTDIYDPKRATEDVKVGKFYMQTGYFKGAYDRFKDATTFDHENVEAVFYLAEAAQKLNLAKEAEQNYQLYLAAVPDGPSARAAKKALGELGSNSKP